jgi:hypothetical protein
LADWFRLPIRSGQPIRVRLVHDSDRDADVRVYNDQGRLIGINQQAPSPEAGSETVNIIDFSAQRDGTAWIRVERAEGGSTPTAPEASPLTYELGIQTDPSNVCRDDSYEENDRRAEAIPIENAVDAPNNLELDVCGDDDDWFVLTGLASSLGLEVEVAEAESSAGLVMTLLGPDGSRLSVPSGTPLNVQRLGASGDWYIHVGSTRGRSSSYRLRAQTTDTWACPRAGEYPSPLTARYLPAGPGETAWLCPDGSAWETDWFELEVPRQRALLTATISPPTVPRRVEASLFRAKPDSQGVTLIREGVSSGEDVVISARVPPTSLYVRVRSFATLGMIRDPGPYEVSYDYQFN